MASSAQTNISHDKSRNQQYKKDEIDNRRQTKSTRQERQNQRDKKRCNLQEKIDKKSKIIYFQLIYIGIDQGRDGN